MTKRLIAGTRRSRMVGLAVVACVAALGCGDDPTGLDDGPTIVGTWAFDQSALAIDSAGGAFVSVDGSAGLSVPDVIASYITEDTTFTIADLSGPQSCDLSIVGRYTYTVTATSLSFELLGDGCTGRRTFLTAGPWSRQSGG